MISAELPPLYRTSRRRLAEGSGEHGTVAAITGKFLNTDHTSAVPSLDFGSKDHSGIIWRLAHTQNKKNRASDQDSATKQAAQRVRGLWLKGRKSWCLHFKHVYLSKLKSTVGVHRMTDSKKKPMDAAHAFHPSSSSFSSRAAIYIVLLLYRPGDGGVWVCGCVCGGGASSGTRANLVFSRQSWVQWRKLPSSATGQVSHKWQLLVISSRFITITITDCRSTSHNRAWEKCFVCLNTRTHKH